MTTVANLMLGLRVTMPFDGFDGLEQVTGRVVTLEYAYQPLNPGETENDTYIVLREDNGRERHFGALPPTHPILLEEIP